MEEMNTLLNRKELNIVASDIETLFAFGNTEQRQWEIIINIEDEPILEFGLDVQTIAAEAVANGVRRGVVESNEISVHIPWNKLTADDTLLLGEKCDGHNGANISVRYTLLISAFTRQELHDIIADGVKQIHISNADIENKYTEYLSKLFWDEIYPDDKKESILNRIEYEIYYTYIVSPNDEDYDSIQDAYEDGNEEVKTSNGNLRINYAYESDVGYVFIVRRF